MSPRIAHSNLSAQESDLPDASATASEPLTNVSGWISIGAASAVLFVGVGYTNTFGVFQEYYQTHLFPQESADKIIVIGSIASSLYLILGALTGPFADFLGYRLSLILGSTLMTGSMFAASVSKAYWQLFLSQGAMFGLGLAFVYMPATSISRQYFDSKMHGLTNGIVVSGGALGGCILPYSVRVMIGKYGLSQSFRILSYIAAGILIPSVLLLQPKTKSSRRQRSLRSALDFSLLQDPRFVGLLVACTIAMTGFLPRYFLLPSSAQAKGIGPTYSSWLLGIMNGLSIFGRIGIGCFADRYGKIKALSLSFLLCGLGHLVFWLPGVTLRPKETETSTALFTLFVVYVGIFGSGFISLFPVVVADLFGKDNLASKTGLLNTTLGLSTLAGPSAVYAIIGSGMHRSWTTGVLSAGLFMIIGGFVLLGMYPMIKRAELRADEERSNNVQL